LRFDDGAVHSRGQTEIVGIDDKPAHRISVAEILWASPRLGALEAVPGLVYPLVRLPTLLQRQAKCIPKGFLRRQCRP
jgi:hypothetical protein